MTRHYDKWTPDAHNIPVDTVARELGLTEGRHGIGPCPACNAERRGSTDKRPPVGMTRDCMGWRCQRGDCGAGGDSIDLVAHVLEGAKLRDLDKEGMAGVRAWYAARGWCKPDEKDGRPPKQHPVITRKPQEEPRDYERPPRDEVLAVWNEALPVIDIAEVSGWIRHRGLDPEKIADRDLARALPSRGEYPAWATYGGTPWPSRGYRLVVPLYGPGGEMESVRARSVRPDAKTKTLAPTGYAVGSLVIADELGRQLLKHGQAPDWWPSGGPLEVIVVEGEPNFLTWATRWGDSAEDAPAVIGIMSGSWTPAIAARIPDGCRVIIRTDHDKAGNKYAEDIHKTLKGRCRILRTKERE